MKNGELKVVCFNENDVIATSAKEVVLQVSGTYSGPNLNDSILELVDGASKSQVTSGTISAGAYNGTIVQNGTWLYIGTELIDKLSEAGSVYGVYSFDSSTNTYTFLHQ